MNAVMTVDLSELDAWSTQVQRASDDLTGIARNGGNSLVQTDFGPILETMMGAYNSLLPSVNQSLEDNGTGMRDHAEALRATARDFTLTEDGVVRRHRANGVDGRDGSSSFFDVADTTIRRAAPTESSLPQISFGFPYDTVCDLVRMLTGFDIRAELAEKIGGDVVSASSQGSSFGSLGTSMKGVAANLQSGGQTISQSWSGGASDAAIKPDRHVGGLAQHAGRTARPDGSEHRPDLPGRLADRTLGRPVREVGRADRLLRAGHDEHPRRRLGPRRPGGLPGLPGRHEGLQGDHEAHQHPQAGQVLHRDGEELLRR